MDESTQDATRVHGIDLAAEPDFDLGSLRVRPARCEVEWNGAPQSLQRRVMQVLVVLAQARGAVVSQDDLVARCWRGLSVSDDAIFRCISKLRKLAADYPDGPYRIETIPGVGYRLTSSGDAGEDHVKGEAAPGDGRFRFGRLWAAAAVALLALAGALIWIGRGGSDQPPPMRVAVQPFQALTNSGGVRALAQQIPNEVVNALGDSQVAAALEGNRAVGQAPGAAGQAAFVVTGILRDDSHDTTVDVRIEDGLTHDALWSATFKRDNREVSDLPLEVAARVADAVSVAIFARSADPPLTDNSALSALLQTSDMIRDGHEGDWAQMIARAQDVVASHPEFAFGHSGLAEAYAAAAESVDIPDRAQSMRDAGRREANLALKLDPQDAGAYAALRDLDESYDYRAHEAVLLRGIRVAKHPKEPLGGLYQYEGLVLDNVGRLREGLAFQLVAQATDQWSPAKMVRLALDYANMGNLTAARDALQKATLRWPNHSSVKAARRYIAGFYESPSDVLALFDRLDAQALPDESNPVWRTFVEARAARSQRVTAAAMNRIRQAADERKISREIEIMMFAALGDPDQAIATANSALDHERLQAWFLFTPVTRNLRQDPGFLRLASRLGLIDYWRETGKRPDFCADRASECGPQLLAAIKSS